MIKFILKLVIVVLLANAAWRAGSVYLTFYRFEDSVRGTIQYRGTKTDAEIRKRILDLAAQSDIPLSGDSLKIRRENTRTIVDGSYEQTVEIFPRYAYTFPFTVHLDIPTSTLP
ncbi:MAG: hypothetical protein A3G76_09235 [Acidobacteria bacterium RIFCSPLOWO2_12_FULL_65_11]|nr:MAG: hypothetical protein A3H95_01580 [Acidobacteria bacterium RIFCSPLOWO2_02_FULL_64_15]OFW32192.1 MAG: hypothetical protein A3G76_09235 [Acidobacteria bacterium RIFCSPLOWO2_12_FULL_65_11]